VRLRVLIPDSVDDALGLIDTSLQKHNVSARSRIAPASLEDVFVAVTMHPKELAA
jgi:hypothetical protein